MIQSIQSSLMGGQMPAKELFEIGLRSSTAMAQMGCNTGERLGKLQMGNLRSAINSCSQLTRQCMSADPIGTVGTADPATTAIQGTMNYWRSLAGLVATANAEMADMMDSSLQEMAELTKTTIAKSGQAGAAGMPLAFCAASGASVLASTQAMCTRIGETARQFAANNGLVPEAATAEEQESAFTRARTQRKAA